MPEVLGAAVFWTSVCVLVYVYFGYYLALRVLAAVGDRRFGSGDIGPAVSVLVAAYNEEGVISARIRDILAQEYPAGKLEVLVGSDGSADRTVEEAESVKDGRVRVLAFDVNRGKAAVMNDLCEAATGEILVFTDAETVFEKGFIRNIVRPYADSRAGAATGRLVYRDPGSEVGRSEGLYFRYEQSIRALEDRLGLLATATGACFSVRRELFVPLGPYDDADYSTPVDVVKAGKAVRFVPDAVAYDIPPADPKAEFRARIRMTARNFIGTLRRGGAGLFAGRPLVGLGIVSHKVLRWFTGWFMLAALVSNIALLGAGCVYGYLLYAQAAFYGLCVLGAVARIPVASQLYAFTVAAAGMAIGVAKSLTGRAPVRWTNVNR